MYETSLASDLQILKFSQQKNNNLLELYQLNNSQNCKNWYCEEKRINLSSQQVILSVSRTICGCSTTTCHKVKQQGGNQIQDLGTF